MLLGIKDGPFEKPIMARFVSDGTLKMLAYLVLLHAPTTSPFIGIEEPENFLYLFLLRGLAEECRGATEDTQILVTTHSPFFLDALRPKEVRALWRDKTGYTRCYAPDEDKKIKAFMDAGANLGELWMENYFGDKNSFAEYGIPPYEKDAS